MTEFIVRHYTPAGPRETVVRAYNAANARFRFYVRSGGFPVISVRSAALGATDV